MPTILDICGVEIPDSVEGLSLMPVMLGAEGAFRDHTCGNCGVVYGVSDGETKYMWFSDDDLEFLFDLQRDPHELHDLSGDPAWTAVLSTQRARLVSWLQANDDPHAVQGSLEPIPYEWDLEWARASSIWNNRGRH
jgi:arylsulfatase A-like enzyme